MFKYSFLALACAAAVVLWNEYFLIPKIPKPIGTTFSDMVCPEGNHSLNLMKNRVPHGGTVTYQLHEGCFSRVTFPANETWRWNAVHLPQPGDWLSFRCGTRLVPPNAIRVAVDIRCGEPGLYQGKGNLVFTKK